MSSVSTSDPHAWLEDVLGEKPLEWVKDRNTECINAVGDPTKTSTYERILGIYDSKDKIPGLSRIGDWYYNFWRDEKHVQGIWRRTTLESYQSDNTEWETVIDVDALPPPTIGTAKTWVWHGTDVLDEGPTCTWDRVLVSLSPGGSDADTTVEFDLKTLSFVKTDGFELPTPAKTRAGYRNRNEVLVGTDFGGDGSCLTDSGYPRVVKSWKRGTPLEEAVTVFEGEKTDISCDQYAYYDRGAVHEFQRRSITFYTAKYWYRSPQDLNNMTSLDDNTPFVELLIPEDAEVRTFSDSGLLELRTDWSPPTPQGSDKVEWKAGSLIALPMKDMVSGDWTKATVLFEPTMSASLEGQSGTKDFLVLKVLRDVQAEMQFWRYTNGEWVDTTRSESQALGVGEDVHVSAVWPNDSNNLWLWRSGYLVPQTLELASAEDGCSEVTKLKAMPHMFDAKGLIVKQHFATSADGTKIPYFLMCREDLVADGSNPTILDAYGGFEISMTPGYSGGVGVGWLERGGVKVIANIRGGGEYGPRWHQAALKENRFKAYEDVEAVAADLINNLKLTNKDKLACIGGSNGGLLVGNMITRPVAASLFGAAVCQVPLLDMWRYSHLLAGASWMAEYGDPDKPEEWKFLRQHSAYHLLRHDCLGIPEPVYFPPKSEVEAEAQETVQASTAVGNVNWKCPKVLFTTSTRDDRVHPGHARKMVASLLNEAQPKGVADKVLYWENTEGGHGGAADNKQRAHMWALTFEFLAQALGLPPSEPSTSAAASEK